MFNWSINKLNASEEMVRSGYCSCRLDVVKNLSLRSSSVVEIEGDGDIPYLLLLEYGWSFLEE